MNSGIVSMTGFGRAEFETPQGRARVEIKSVNQKFFELSQRLPPDLMPYNDRVRKIVQSRVRRGKVYLNVFAPEGPLTPARVSLNVPAAREYARALKKLDRLAGGTGRVSPDQIARMPDVIRRTVSPRDVDRLWGLARRGVEKALRVFDRSRRTEGRTLARDIASRVRRIDALARRIRSRAPQVVRAYKARTVKRLAGNGSNGQKDRLSAEVAAFARASDITEEVVRLKSHVRTLKATLARGGEAGRKLDFICQEMVREANTMGAKANDYAISNDVIQIKAELEKIREQVQNLE